MTTSQATSSSNAAAPQTTVKPAGKAPTARKATSKKSTPLSAKRAPSTAVKKVPAPTKTKTATAQPTVNKAPAVKSKTAKEKKVKVVRDSFTIPKPEFMQIAEMKKRAMTLGVEVKKSELIRAGLQLISGLQDTAFKKALAAVPTLKTGRPAKD